MASLARCLVQAAAGLALLAGAALARPPKAHSAPIANTSVADTPAIDQLRLDQVRMLGSHNSYRKFPSPAEEARIKAADPKGWAELDYGHPPLESQLALGLQQFEIDVAPDPQGGLYAKPYADATPEVRALMAAPGAKVLHIAGLDTEAHCLTFRKCLTIFARWSDAHPNHEPVVILVNSSDPDRLPGLFDHDVKFDQAGIDALNQDVFEVIGRRRLVTPDDVRGTHATLREAVLAKAWPTLGAMRGKFLFILDGADAHEAFQRAGHASLRGRAMFGWFDEAAPEAAVFNVQDPAADQARIRRMVAEGFIVRTRSDANVVEARTRDGARMKAALSSGAQIVSTDYYAGAPDPEGFGFIVDFEGPMLRCNEVVTTCTTAAAAGAH
jgi:hypothetical protein